MKSITAQVYLEILRILTVRRTGRWLFKRVESAGLNISTTRDSGSGSRGLLPQAIQALPTAEYDGNDFPYEIDRVKARIESYTQRRLYDSDFRTFEYILCFDEAAAKMVQDRSQLTKAKPSLLKPTAKIVALRDCSSATCAEMLADGTRRDKVVSAIKAAVKDFVHRELGPWSALSRVHEHWGRLLQFRMPSDRLPMGSTSDDIAARLEAKTSGIIKVTASGAVENDFLVSVLVPLMKTIMEKEPSVALDALRRRLLAVYQDITGSDSAEILKRPSGSTVSVLSEGNLIRHNLSVS